jgi:hypothetical protein
MATTSKLTTLAEQRAATGFKTMSPDSISWLKEKIQEVKRPDRVNRVISKESMRQAFTPKLGLMYLFYYDPKTKADLPYWDTFPLVLVLEKYNDGFLGLNLHYLPQNYRIAFLTKLMKFAQMGDENEIKRMRVTYDILTASRRYAEFKPCIKRYLNTHLRSRLLTIQPNEWDTAMMLPLQQFRGAKTTRVWKDSIQEYKDHMAYFRKDEE